MFPMGDDERDKIWKDAHLTVDTNVLLDLYRLSSDTRKDLQLALETFKDRFFLTRQVAWEFARNRNRVRLSTHNDYKQAIEDIDKFIKGNVINELLKKYRFIPKDDVEKLIAQLGELYLPIKQSIEASEKRYDEEINKQFQVISWLKNKFSCALEEEWTSSELKSNIEIAKDRIEKKIPPGYLDKAKDDDRKYGDYFVWQQIIEKCKKLKKPIILVTSEQKDDWWESYHGKTVGLRPELLDEFWKETHQKILAYSTFNFITYALEKQDRTFSDESKEEIRSLSVVNLDKRKLGRIDQIMQNDEHDEYQNEGLIQFNLSHEAYYFTVTASLIPHMAAPPHILCQLTDCPENTPAYSIYGNTGTVFDINIHLRSQEINKKFPVGKYIIKYIARVNIMQGVLSFDGSANYDGASNHE